MAVTTPPVDFVGEGPTSDGGGHGDRASTGRLGDRIFSVLAHGAGLLVITMVVLVGAFLLSQALPALAKNQASFLTSSEWQVDGQVLRFGIANLLWATVIISVVAMA